MTDLESELQRGLGAGYRILHELGGGGMSRVFVADEVALSRRVVVKVLPPELAEGMTAERFRREIQLAATLQHPHVVPLLTAGQAGRLVYYVMPYVEGESLRDRLARDRRLPAAHAVRIARDVAEALEYAHGHGVVHRDIKPDNILLASGHALVLDFGVAKALRAAVEPGHATTVGVALGTPLYMAPEQAAGGGNVDGRADLYALGVVLYEMLSGRPPFESDSPYDLIAAHIADPPEPLRRRSAETPAALEVVVMRCLAKRTAERYQTAGLLLAELEALGTAPGGVRAIRSTGPRRWVWAAGAALVLAGTAAALGAGGLFSPRTLVGEGVLTERERVILTDFDNRTSDSTLGVAVTEAFRIDLAQSSAVALLSPVDLAGALARMQRVGAPLDLALGRELARREGIKAVVGGEIAAVGETYVIWVRLMNAETGELLAGFREAADDPATIISAVDRLSKQLRRRIGESLAHLEAAPPLERVTTGSLVALRAYSRGVRAQVAGEYGRARAALAEAVRLDTAFASAYRSLAMTNRNLEMNRQEEAEALVRAFQLRDRLPARERHLVMATYYSDLNHRPELAIEAYESVLRDRPNDRIALTNLAILYLDLGRPSKALPFYRRNVEVNPDVISYRNLLEAEFDEGSETVAESLFTVMRLAYPGSPTVEHVAALMASARQQYDTAAVHYRRLADAQGELEWRAWAHDGLANLARLHGRLVESERHQAQSIRARDTSETAVAVQLALLAASIDVQIRGQVDRGIRRTRTTMRSPAFASIPALNRPYLEIAYNYASAGRADLARAAVDARGRALQTEGVAGQAALASDAHEHWTGIVHARTLAAGGQTDSALARLRNPALPGYDVWFLPELGAVYDAAGQLDSARAAYERFLVRRALQRDELDGWHRPRILFRLGELYEQRGDRARAADYYSQFAELWRDADADLQPRVAEARRRLAALTAEPGRQ